MCSLNHMQIKIGRLVIFHVYKLKKLHNKVYLKSLLIEKQISHNYSYELHVECFILRVLLYANYRTVELNIERLKKIVIC